MSVQATGHHPERDAERLDGLLARARNNADWLLDFARERQGYDQAKIIQCRNTLNELCSLVQDPRT